MQNIIKAMNETEFKPRAVKQQVETLTWNYTLEGMTLKMF